MDPVTRMPARTGPPPVAPIMPRLGRRCQAKVGNVLDYLPPPASRAFSTQGAARTCRHPLHQLPILPG